MENRERSKFWRVGPWVVGVVVLGYLASPSLTKSDPPATKPAAGDPPPASSYDQVSPVLLGKESFAAMMAKDKTGKADVAARQQKLLEERYNLSRKVDEKIKMSRGKPIPVGPTARLTNGSTWDSLAALSPDEVREKGLFPKGFYPLPHPHHEVGGMVFPQAEVKLLPRLTRFDLDFDLPEHFLPEFPPAIFLTTRPDLGDVSQGKVVTVENYNEIFNGILNSKDLEGVRLLVTQFPQQQFNATFDRKAEAPSLGVACFDCHVNGHTSGATHLVGDIRPQSHRRRIETPSLRGVNIQRLFGSQRALKSIEDFTEFEQRAAYFDGDILSASAKGINPLERGSQVHFMSEFQELLAFPPAPLGVDGKLDPRKFAESSPEVRGQALFFGKAKCSTCHPAPYYTDNTMHDLQVERFYKPMTVNGLTATTQGPIKTFPLRGIKDSPPYLHDGRLLTLEDTVEFFNLILETKLTGEEKIELVAFMRQL
ncbi:cytochrome B6 [Fimbriiglobus ruber]|uniref:Cytochrome c peroxidase n=1 Tax=Fimbriiglobus ruber TaxID=1908690 RepID=A0A225DFI4_9BACT|nr:cytochrome B6 [Fimbriiglobus ruber]OWK34847.1 Cytochrome c peroxidase [Fimbriiglobus ruber]